jgi:hypothetical protein
MGDRYVSFPLRAVILPFGGRYEPLLVAFGQIAAWLTLLLIASFHVRRQIGGRVWRRLHYASFVAFWLAVAHGLLLGTEGTVWANVLCFTTGSVITFLTCYRVLASERRCSMAVTVTRPRRAPAMRSNCDFFRLHAKDVAVRCELERYVTATEGFVEVTPRYSPCCLTSCFRCVVVVTGRRRAATRR